VADLDDDDLARRIVDRIDNPVVSLANPIAFPGGELLAAAEEVLVSTEDPTEAIRN
jgi:hypothetical protein